jgi:hypothetical protein
VGCLAALNAALAAADRRDDARRIGARAETVGAAAARELPLLRPLPGEVFDVSARLSCRVDTKARVCVRQSYYSVPSPLRRPPGGGPAGRGHGPGPRRRHGGGRPHPVAAQRAARTWCWITTWRSSPVNPAPSPGRPRWWPHERAGRSRLSINGSLDAARHRLGDGPGTRALVGVLLLHRTLTAAAVLAGIEAALTLGSFDPDLVAVEARRSMLTQTTPIPVVLPPTAAALAAIPRPAPSLAGYDQLLKEATA